MTRAQKRVVDRLRKLGAAVLGPGIPKDTQRFDLAGEMRLMAKFYGKKETERYRKLLHKHGVTSEAVWCSDCTLYRLRELKLIEPVEGLSGVWRVTNKEST